MAATVAGLVTLWRARHVKKSEDFGQFGNGVLGLVTMVALIGGAWLYYLEGRDNPKINVSASATVVGIAPARWPGLNHPLQSVLVQFSVIIENRGERGHWFNCAALDIIGLDGMENRTRPYPDDLGGVSLLQIDPRAPEDLVWARCVGRDARAGLERIEGFEERRDKAEEERQQRRQGDYDSVNPLVFSGRPPSGARYRDFYMEPGERTTRTWEQPVSCRYNAVRMIFKLPKPYGTADYETKILVPIADVCRGLRLVQTYPAGRD